MIPPIKDNPKLNYSTGGWNGSLNTWRKRLGFMLLTFPAWFLLLFMFWCAWYIAQWLGILIMIGCCAIVGMFVAGAILADKLLQDKPDA